MEKTVVMIKPDGIQKKLVGEITRRIKHESLLIVFSKKVKLTETQVCELYKDSLRKFPQIKKEMIKYMTKEPSIIMIVEGEEAIQKMRKIRGLSNPANSPVGSIRRDFAGDYDMDELTPKGKVTKNIMHSSGSKEEVEFETKLFFGEKNGKNKIYIISGGPGTGKTSIINELSKRFRVIPEAAREVGDTYPEFRGKSIKEIEMPNFQRLVFEFQKKAFNNSDKGDIVFSDRGFGDTLAYYKFHNLKIPKDELDYAKKFRCSEVFILDFLNFYEKDEFRQETNKEQNKIHMLITIMYKKLGYKPIIVPFMSVSERVDFILSKINNSKVQK